MIRIDCVQYSVEWWTARAGIPTASNFDKIVTPTKGEKSKSSLKYACELAAEIAGMKNPNFFTERENRPKSFAMANGTNMEPEARRKYQAERDVDVKELGFCTTDNGQFACSPDGEVIGDAEGPGGLELKVPNPETHAMYLLKGELPDDYRCQVHGQLLVTGWKFVDFMSYNPWLAPFIVRVRPDSFTVKLAAALEDFHVEYMDVLARLGLQPRKAQ